jgi:hypothetical protein
MVASGLVLRHPGLDIEIASPRSGECSPYVLAAWLPCSSLRIHGTDKFVLGSDAFLGPRAAKARQEQHAIT